MNNNILKVSQISRKILELLGFDAEPYVSNKENTYLVRLQLDDPSLLIGKQGESLDALQHLLRLLIGRELEAEHITVVVDINGYRDKRTKNIEQQARETAYKVRSTGKEAEIPNLNSFERRLVHSVVGNIADVESESHGEGSSRKIVIKLKR